MKNRFRNGVKGIRNLAVYCYNGFCSFFKTRRNNRVAPAPVEVAPVTVVQEMPSSKQISRMLESIPEETQENLNAELALNTIENSIKGGKMTRRRKRKHNKRR
jgi:hypothetical protein